MLGFKQTVHGSDLGSITIDNALDGVTYTIYKLLDLESYDSDSGRYVYKLNDTFEEFVKNGEGQNYLSVDEDIVTWISGDKAGEFAKKALAYAKANSVENSGQKVATGTTVLFENLELGYYLVDSSVGVLCSLDTTASNVVIKEKNSAPTIIKQVSSDNLNYGNENSVSIGDEAYFKTTITVGKGSENYVLHDYMEPGLSLDESSIMIEKLSGTSVESLTLNDDYSLLTPSDGCSFELAFLKCDTFKENDQIILTYKATLNKDAVVGEGGNKNKTWLKYGDDNKTIEVSTTTYTYSLSLFKYHDDKIGLGDVEFTLTKNDEVIDFVDLAVAGDTKKYQVRNDETSFTSKLITNSSGKLLISGLGEGEYKLSEIKAPRGFNKLQKPIEIKIDGDGAILLKVNGAYVSVTGSLEIENKSGTLLPSTGGSGTTMLYGVGGVLILGSLLFLLSKKKK